MREQNLIPYNERFRQRAIEAFDLGIHLGRTRIDIEINNAILLKKDIKMVSKLTPVISLEMSKQQWKNFRKHLHEI